MLKLVQVKPPSPFRLRCPQPFLMQTAAITLGYHRSFQTSPVTLNKLSSDTCHQDTPTKTSNDGKIVVDISKHPIIKRLPKFLHPYTVRFLNAPVSHVTSFMILHELTAIAPLFGLWGLFSYYEYMPPGIPQFLIESGTDFINRMGERNSWTSLKSEEGAKMVLQGAAAYAIVKVLLPVRAAVSLLVMPWFARWVVIPCTRTFRRLPKKHQSQTGQATNEAISDTQEFQKFQKKNVESPVADPRGQIWNQDLPVDPPQFKAKKVDPKRPSL